MLKKVLTVRREKVYNALAFLIANNPQYHDVELNDDSQILKIIAKYLIFGILDLQKMVLSGCDIQTSIHS